MKRVLMIAVAAGTGLALSVGCGRQGASPGTSRKSDSGTGTGIVLTVGESRFTQADFDRYVRHAAGEGTLSAVSLSRLFDDFIDEKLLLEAARRQGLSLTEEEKKAYLSRLAGESSPEEPKISPEESRGECLFDRPLIEKLREPLIKNVQVQDQEISSYYDEQKKDFLVSERVKVSQILLETENRAVEVLRRLENASEEEFRKIAQEESAGPEAFKGGEMGVYKIGDLPYEMEKVIFSLEEGRLSPVVESSYGFHIFRLDKKFPPQLLSKGEAASSIRLVLLDRKIKNVLATYLQEIRKSISWNSYPERLSFVYQRNES